MTDPEKLMNDFMSTKNKEVLGEETSSSEGVDDNYLADNNIIKSGFSNESVSEDDKAAAMIKNIMNTLIAVPILIGAIFLVLFIIIKIGPSILNFIRGFFIKLGSL